jgi:hypothetical protein
VSAKWRAAWQLLLARSAHATTTATRKRAAEAIVLAVAWRPWPKALSKRLATLPSGYAASAGGKVGSCCVAKDMDQNASRFIG